MRWPFSTAVLGAAVFFSALPPVRSADWVTLANCQYMEHASNDGDSFHVKQGGKEYIFRLLYVDCAERKEMGLTERTDEQARYFKILKRDLYLMSDQATAFTAQQLKARFCVKTQWEDAKGNSALPRHYAVVETAAGSDLAELLVQAGLARVYGRPVPHPDGRKGAEVVKDLEALELAAREGRIGAWAFSRQKK
jgi:endonuclease YncB( thermonuclease family)